MLIHEPNPRWYVNRLQNGDYYAFAGFSDAEWCCILGLRDGEKTGLGQIISTKHGKRLEEVLRRRKDDERFLFAVPKCLCDRSRAIFGDGCIDWWLGNNNLRIEAYERDAFLDEQAERAELYPLIRQLQRMKVGMIGPRPLLVCDNFLHLRWFVDITTPNLHLEPDGIGNAVAKVYNLHRVQVILVCAGVSAAVIIDQLYDYLHNDNYHPYLIDCGSIFDAFAGIGGQREWRAKLYADPVAHEKWKEDNIRGNR